MIILAGHSLVRTKSASYCSREGCVYISVHPVTIHYNPAVPHRARTKRIWRIVATTIKQNNADFTVPQRDDFGNGTHAGQGPKNGQEHRFCCCC